MSKLKLHVSHDFAKLNANDAYTFGKSVIGQITANASTFPNLPITLAELGTLTTALHDTYAQYQQYGESKKGAYTDAHNLWKIKFSRTADYVDLIADGDESIINKSGFKPTKSESTPSTKIERLTGLDGEGMRTPGVVHVESGAISVSSNKGYCFILAQKDVQIAQNGEQIDIYQDDKFICTIYAGNTKMHDFNGLPSVTKLQLRGFGFNPAGMGLLTDGVDILVQ